MKLYYIHEHPQKIESLTDKLSRTFIRSFKALHENTDVYKLEEITRDVFYKADRLVIGIPFKELKFNETLCKSTHIMYISANRGETDEEIEAFLKPICDFYGIKNLNVININDIEDDEESYSAAVRKIKIQAIKW